MSLDEAIQFFNDVEDQKFHNLGTAVELSFNSTSTLGAAIKVLVSEDTDDVAREGMNELTAFVGERARTARLAKQPAEEWNDFTQTTLALGFDFRRVFDIAVFDVLPTSVRENVKVELQSIFFISFIGIASDSLGASAFYTATVECLKSGHLPMGWDGIYPDGKLIVF